MHSTIGVAGILALLLSAACTIVTADEGEPAGPGGGGTSGVGGAGPASSGSGSGGSGTGGAGGVDPSSGGGGAGGVDSSSGGGGAGGSGAEETWSKAFGDVDMRTSESAVGVATDGEGNIVLLAFTPEPIDFGGGLLSAGGSVRTASLAKLDRAGNHLWSTRFEVPDGLLLAQDLAIDASGNIIVAAQAVGTSVDLGGGAVALPGPNWNTVVAKFDAAGNTLWSEAFGNVYARAVAVDAAGDVVLAGGCDADADLGGGALGSTGACAAKVDAAGHHVWSRHVSGPSLRDLACDAMGDIVLTGYVGYIEGETIDDPGTADVYVAKLDSAGNDLWSETFGGESVQIANSVAIDGSGDIVLAGTFFGSVDFGGGPLVSAGGRAYDPHWEGTLQWGGDIFLAKLDGAGDFVWNRRYGDAGVQAPWGVAATGDGSIALTGGFLGVVDFGTGPLTGNNRSGDVFVANLDATGNTSWSRVYSGGPQQVGQAVALGPAGHVIVAGVFHERIDFGFGLHETSAEEYEQSDIFLAKLDGR